MERLRFALLSDGVRLERWHIRCLDELEAVADLTAVVFAPEPAHAPEPRSRLLRWYARRFTRTVTVPAADRLAHLPVSTAKLGAVDFVLKLGRAAIPAGVAGSTRFGLWCFQHESEETELPFFAEVYAGEGVTRAALVALGDGGEQLAVLEAGVFRTNTCSYAASRGAIEDAIAAWPARACRRVSGTAPAAPTDTAPIVRAPSLRGGGLVRFAARIGARRVGLAWQRFFRHPQWNVGVLGRPVASLLESGTYADAEVEWFPLEGRHGFFADPFAIERGNRLLILCEYFDYRTSKGRICALDYSAEGFSSRHADALSLPLHTSYPYMLDVPEGVFCVPETAAAGEIALYRADEPAGRWSKTAVLVADFPGVDPTIFRHEDRWWLACTRLGPQEDAELWLWHAPDLKGPWIPHTFNPVKTDASGARPGGRPFVHEGSLYRPAQDCSHIYGGRVVLQHVTRLSPTEFAETPVTTIEGPSRSRYPLGPHTLTPIGDAVLVDARRSVFVPAAFRAFIAIWMRALAQRVRRPG